MNPFLLAYGGGDFASGVNAIRAESGQHKSLNTDSQYGTMRYKFIGIADE